MVVLSLVSRCFCFFVQNEWYPLGSDKLAEYRSETRYRVDTGPPQSQTEFYRMAGHNLTKFVEFLTDRWQPFYARFDQAAPNDAEENKKTFDAATIINEHDYKMLYRDNHDFLTKALTSLSVCTIARRSHTGSRSFTHSLTH